MPEPSVPASADGDDVGVSLALDLSCKFDPTVPEEQVVSKIMAGKFKSKFLEELPEIDLDWLKDNSLDKDAQDIQAFVRDCNDKKTRLNPAVAKLSAYAKTCWATSSGYTGPKPKAKVVSDSKTASSASRMYAKLTLSADSLLRAAVPADVGVFTDSFNGRWRLTFRPTGAAEHQLDPGGVTDRRMQRLALGLGVFPNTQRRRNAGRDGSHVRQGPPGRRPKHCHLVGGRAELSEPGASA